MSKYRAESPPNRPEALPEYLARETLRIESQANEFDTAKFDVLNNEPDRPRIGMIAYADGTNWDPGGGVGLYVYKSGGWTLIA